MNEGQNVLKSILPPTDDGEQLSDAITSVFVELSKLEDILQKPIEQMTALEQWFRCQKCV
ncbi:MAG: hypothetical protein LBH86_05255 [Oscillospiraceae bacterium]|nr:hypothetical protein [Oscillospiraceae bacterium]